MPGRVAVAGAALRLPGVVAACRVVGSACPAAWPSPLVRPGLVLRGFRRVFLAARRRVAAFAGSCPRPASPSAPHRRAVRPAPAACSRRPGSSSGSRPASLSALFRRRGSAGRRTSSMITPDEVLGRLPPLRVVALQVRLELSAASAASWSYPASVCPRPPSGLRCATSCASAFVPAVLAGRRLRVARRRSACRRLGLGLRRRPCRDCPAAALGFRLGFGGGLVLRLAGRPGVGCGVRRIALFILGLVGALRVVAAPSCGLSSPGLPRSSGLPPALLAPGCAAASRLAVLAFAGLGVR